MILPARVEKASLIAPPIIGIVLLISNRIPFALTVSTADDRTLRIVRNVANKDDKIPKENVINLLNAFTNEFKFIFLFLFEVMKF